MLFFIVIILTVLVFTVLEEDGVAITVLPRKEVIRRLRDRNEPILLFGETELVAFKRLRKLEISEPEINRVRCEFFLIQLYFFNVKLFYYLQGLRNDFQEALERVDEAYLNEILCAQNKDIEQSTEGTQKRNIGDVKVQTDAMSYEEIISLVNTIAWFF